MKRWQKSYFLNAVATRRRDPDFCGYSSTGAALLDDILLERRKELAYEGHRYWKRARYNRDVVRVDRTGNYKLEMCRWV